MVYFCKTSWRSLLPIMGSLSLFVIIGCSTESPSESSGANTMNTTSDNDNLLTESDYFKVRSKGFSGVIKPSDPRYKAALRLLEIGRLSQNYEKTSLGELKLAPVHRLSVYRAGKQGTDTKIASLDHYSPEHMIWTDKYGLRKIDNRVENEMVELWRSIREETKESK